MFYDESKKPFISRSKGQRSRSPVTKNSAGVGICTLVSAGFFQFQIFHSTQSTLQHYQKDGIVSQHVNYNGLGGIRRDLLKLKRSLFVMSACPYCGQSGRPCSLRYSLHRTSSDSCVRKRSPICCSSLRRSHQHR